MVDCTFCMINPAVYISYTWYIQFPFDSNLYIGKHSTAELHVLQILRKYPICAGTYTLQLHSTAIVPPMNDPKIN